MASHNSRRKAAVNSGLPLGFDFIPTLFLPLACAEKERTHSSRIVFMQLRSRRGEGVWLDRDSGQEVD